MLGLITAAVFIQVFPLNAQSTPSTDEEYWVSLCHDSKNTGFAQGPAPATNHTLWRIDVNGVDRVAPIVADGKIFMVSYENGDLLALSSSTGQKIWRKVHAFNSLFWGNTPAVADDRVYFGDGAGRIIAFDKDIGNKIFQEDATLGHRDIYAINAADGRLFFNSLDGNTYCVNASNGTPIWNHNVGNRYIAPPAVADGRVFQGSLCLNESDG